MVGIKAFSNFFRTLKRGMVKTPMMITVNLVLTVKDLIWLSEKLKILSMYFLVHKNFKTVNHVDLGD